MDRVFILHLPAAKYKFRGNASVKLVTVMIWIFAGFMGSIPVVGWSGITLHKDLTDLEKDMGYLDTCFYVSYEIDHNYAVFIIISQVALFISSVLCLVDVHIQMRYVAVPVE